MREASDLVVVGAGIVGTLVVALARLRHPDWRIQLVDRSQFGQGATGCSAGLMPVVGRTEQARAMAVRARRGYVELRERGLDLPETEVQACWVVSASRRRELERDCGPLKPLAGVRYRAWSTTGPMPHLANEELVLDGGRVARLDAPAALRRLVRWARRQGVECHEGIAVNRVSGGPTWCLECSDGVARYGLRVVLATGPWLLLDPLWRRAAPIDRARTKKVITFHVEPAPEPDAYLTLFPESDVFLLPARGYWLLSTPCQTWDWLPEHRSLSPEDVELARSIMMSRFPRWNAQLRGASVFGDAYTPDRQPLVQRLAESLVRVGCCSGSGVRLGPALAEKALAKLS